MLLDIRMQSEYNVDNISYLPALDRLGHGGN